MTSLATLQSVPWNQSAQTPPTPRPLRGPVAGDIVLVQVPVTGFETTDEIVQASFTAKLAKTDPDDAATTVQKIYRSDDPSGGMNPSVNAYGSAGTAYLITFPLDGDDTTELLTEHGYDIRVWVNRPGVGVLQRTIVTGTIIATSGWTDLDSSSDVAPVVITLPQVSLAAFCISGEVADITIGGAMASAPTLPAAEASTTKAAAAGVGANDDIAGILTALGATIVGDYDATANVRAVGSVVGVHDDRRCSTPDGQVFVPGVVDEGILLGNISQMNALTGFTFMVEFSSQPGDSSSRYLFSRMSGATATTRQIIIQTASGTRLLCAMGDGVSTTADVRSAVNSLEVGKRYRAIVRYDGAAGTDATRITFWIAPWNPSTNTFDAGAQSASSVQTAGVPAALITVSANAALGRQATVGGAVPWFGAYGGNGEVIRAWGSALSDANILAELASDTPVIATDLSYNFSGATPYVNLGSWGAAGDGTKGSNTVLCSGDRLYAGIASAGTARPAITTGGAYGTVITANGTTNYLRNITRGQLEGITADTMAFWCGVVPTENAYRNVFSMGVAALNALMLQVRTDVQAGIHARTNTSPNGSPGQDPAPTGIRAIVARRTSNGSGTTGYRNGLNAELTATQTPESSGAVTRLTVFGANGDTVLNFADGTYRRLLIVRGLTSAAAINAAQEQFAYWAAAFGGATIT